MPNGLLTLLKKLHHYVFDFSASENNRREVEDILVAVLAEAPDEGDFDETLRRVIIHYEGGKKNGEPRYIAFRYFMNVHVRHGEQMAPYRVRAEHLLEDLPRIFGDKNTSNEPPRPPSATVEPISMKKNDR